MQIDSPKIDHMQIELLLHFPKNNNNNNNYVSFIEPIKNRKHDNGCVLRLRNVRHGFGP